MNTVLLCFVQRHTWKWFITSLILCGSVYLNHWIISYIFKSIIFAKHGPFPMPSEVMMILLLYFRWAACPVPSGSQRSWKHRQTMQGWTPHGCQHQPRSMRVMHIWQHPGLEVPIWCLGKAGRGDDWESLSVRCSHFLRRFSTCFRKSWVLKHLFSGVCVWMWVPWVLQSLVSDPFYPADLSAAELT